MNFSLIVPCYNEGECITAFFRSATLTLSTLRESCEIIFVNDGSVDSTFNKLKTLIADTTSANVSYKVISFSRNFGKEAAILAGLEQSSGEYIGIIDADMQQDPQIAVKMLHFLKSHPEFDSVAAVQEKRKEAALISGLKTAFYRIFNALTDVDLRSNASDFRVFTRQVAEALMNMPEYHRFSKGLFSWIGFNTHYITYQANKRLSGKSSWSTKGLFRYALSGITSFSIKPLRIAMTLGLIISLCALTYFIITVVSTIVGGNEIPGYPTLICVLLLTSGIQLFSMGIIGEYIGLSYVEGKHRPQYITKAVISKQASGAPPDDVE